jgi:short-subunit dehydrogenase
MSAAGSDPTSALPGAGVPRRPLALVTGASSGIGRELARELAERGHDLVVVADDRAVTSLVSELPDVEVTAVEADLATEEGNARLQQVLDAQGRPLDVAAVNAGIGTHGRFDQIPLEDDVRLVRLNVESTVRVTKAAVRPMVAAGRGRVLITSSIAATAPGPYHATYAASKAFGLSFAEALRYELKETGVGVTALMPGPTDTEFFDRAQMQDTRIGSMESKDDPREVARQGLEALFADQDKVVAGSARNKAQTASGRLMPERAKAAVQARLTEPGSGRD